MGAGMIRRLDQLITFQSRTESSDEAGGTTSTWEDFTTVPTVWAKVRPLTGGERLEEGAFNASGMWEFTIRNRSDISEKDRIRWKSESYNIRQVNRRGERYRYLVIVAERGAPQ